MIIEIFIKAKDACDGEINRISFSLDNTKFCCSIGDNDGCTYAIFALKEFGNTIMSFEASAGGHCCPKQIPGLQR